MRQYHLTSRVDIGDNTPYNDMKRQVTNDFFAINSVFSLDEATEALSPPGGKSGTVERLKYHLQIGRLKLVAREIYAVVPPGVAVERFRPDPFLVAAAIRPAGVFSYHSAMELLGAAHAFWNICTLYVEKPRKSLALNGITVKFLNHPKALRSNAGQSLGTRSIERLGKLLRSTGPERTLVEGFRRPDLSGGLEELVVSAGGFSILDLELLEDILHAYDVGNLWAAVGWFLERFQRTFHVPDETLHRMELNRPKSPQYLVRSRRGGKLELRWNLILPNELSRLSEPDAP